MGTIEADIRLSMIDEILSCPALDFGLSFCIISSISLLDTDLKSNENAILSTRKDLYDFELVILMFFDRAGPMSVKNLLKLFAISFSFVIV